MGGPGHNEFQKELRKLAERFQRALKGVRPTLKLFETLKEENELAALLESPRSKATPGRINRRGGDGEWFGDRDREVSPTLRKGRKHQQGIEVHTLSSDEENGPLLHPKKRRGANEPTANPKKTKRILDNSMGTLGDCEYFKSQRIC